MSRLVSLCREPVAVIRSPPYRGAGQALSLSKGKSVESNPFDQSVFAR